QALALGLQALALRPFPHDGKLVLERFARVVAEERRLAAGERVRGVLGETQRVRDRLHQRRAIRTETVQRAAAREGLEHAPVQLLPVDAPAKIEQILELAARSTFRDDGLCGARADALHRAETVADALRAERRERRVRAIHARRLELDAE